jgi:hypothetical protein
MWKTLRMCFIIEKSNRSNLYSLLFVTLLIAGFMYIASDEHFNNPLVDATSEYQSTSSAISKFQVVDVEAVEEGGNLFGSLTRLRQAISLKSAALKLEKEEILHKATQRVIKQREDIYLAEDYDIVRDLIPSEIHNENEKVLVQTLMDKEISYKQDPLDYWQFLLTVFAVIGFAWFPLLSFYTSGIMIEDFRHTSILKGYPVRFDQYVIAKSITKMIMIFSFIALIFIVSLPLIQYKGLGIAEYPVIIYNGTSVAYTIPQYILLCISIMFVIAIFTLLLSIIFNMIFKNMYITLFIQMLFFFLPIMFPSLVSLLPYNPFNFLNFNMIIEGGQLTLINPVDITFKGGFIVLFICIAIMLVIVQRFLSTGKLKRA